MSSASNLALASTNAAPARNARVLKMFSLAELFPEIPVLSTFTERNLRGFEQPGPGVPSRIPDFVHNPTFIRKLAIFLNSSWWMFAAVGPTGCGKSDGFVDFFARLNCPLLQDCATRDTKIWDLLCDREIVNGDTVINKKKLYKAIEFGFPYLLDEVYKLQPSVTSKLHMLRDRGEIAIDDKGTTLKAAPGFKFLQTSNQGGFGDFSGAHPGESVQDVAFLNGSVVVACDYPDADTEKAIVSSKLRRFSPQLANDASVCDDIAMKMVSVANSARAAYVGNDDATNDRIEIPFSTRTLVMWAEFFVAFRDLNSGTHPLYEALDFVALDRACPSTRIAVDGFVKAHFGHERAQP